MIYILTTSQESERRSEEFKNLSQKFIEVLDVDEVIAHLLVTEGFSSINEISMVIPSDLASIEGFDNDLSEELINRAKNYLDKEKVENLKMLKNDGMEDYLLSNDIFTTDQLITLKNNNIKTRDQLADLSSFELMEFLNDIDNKKADEVILESESIGLRSKMEENKDKKSSYSGKLQLKKTFNAGQIKQSFSHGRSRSVSVEVKRKRTLTSLKNEESNFHEVPSSDEPEKSLVSKPKQKSEEIQGVKVSKDDTLGNKVESHNLKEDTTEKNTKKEFFKQIESKPEVDEKNLEKEKRSNHQNLSKHLKVLKIEDRVS